MTNSATQTRLGARRLRIIRTTGRSHRIAATESKRTKAITLDLKLYRKQQQRIRELERILDHVLLYAELKLREADRRPDISLDDLRRRYKL